MFIERLMNETNAPLVERVLQFSAARHKLIAENMANIDTPGYRQKDLSQAKFFSMLRERAAQRARMDTIAANIANLNTTRDAEGRPVPYRRRFAVFASGLSARGADAAKPGVHVGQIKQDMSPFQQRHQPGHPDADANGTVLY